MNKALEHLDKMISANIELYEKILDTHGFAFHFNELVKLAQSAAQPTAADYTPPCPDCGAPMAEQRPGSYECLEEGCGAHSA